MANVGITLRRSEHTIRINRIVRAISINHTGRQGPQGPAGPGLPSGGTVNQVAAKASSANFDVIWKTLSKSDVGLGNVDNTSDDSKPISAATKAYVDALSLGLFIKVPVRVASTVNVTISSPGAIIDGVTLSSGDRVLLKDQSLGPDNGIYIFNGASSTMTRSTDADTSAEVKAGTYVFVTEGVANADTAWVLTTDDPITLGTTSLTFTSFGLLTVPDATALVKGKLKLAGDLGGTADTPLIKRTERFIIAPYGDSRPADYVCAGPSNNHIEINNAIIAANALPRGADVELLDGYFELGGAVMRLPNVHIYGQGVGHTKVGVVAGANFTMFDMNKVTYNPSNPLENSIIAEMEISGENMAPSSEKKAINGGNFKDCKIYRIWAHDTTATGIGDDDFYGTTIDQCLVTDCGYQNKHIITGASWSGNAFTFTTADAHGYTAWAKASGILTADGMVSDGETVTISGVIYTFKTTLSGAAFEVLIGATAATALTNLKSAVNLTGTIGTDYGTGTTKHPTVTAGTLTSTTLTFSANTIGSAGNAITTTETGANLSFGASTLSGGVSGNRIVIAGMIPALYNGTFNVTTVPDSTHFTISSATNSGGLNFTIDPGTPTTFGSSSDSILGHNGIGIASGALEAESCIVTNCICIGNQNNNFLIEADANNSNGNEVFIFSNCVSINAGSCGFRNTGSINAQFNNCYDYGSPIGGQAISTYSTKAISAVSWSGGVATFDTSAAVIFTAGEKVTISSMVPEAYNGHYTVQSVDPGLTSFTVNLAADPGPAVHFGTSSYEAHSVDGSSFNSPIFSNNLDIGLYLPDSGVTVNNPVIKNCYNYGARLNSCSNSRIEEARIYHNGRQGISIIMGSGVFSPMDHVKITGHVYNNGQRYANCDGIDVDPSANSAAIQNLELDVHAFDDQVIKTQRYGVILRSGGTIANVHVKGNLLGNATAPILVQNTGNTIFVDALGVNPSGQYSMGNITGSTTFDPVNGRTQIGTLTGDVTAVMPTPPIGGLPMCWILAQDATGGRKVTLPANATMNGQSGSAIQLNLLRAATAVSVVDWIYDKVNGKWRGTSVLPASLNFVTSAVNYTLTDGNDIVQITATGKTATMHDVTRALPKRYTIQNASSGVLIVAVQAAQAVNGATTISLPAGASINLFPDATNANWLLTSPLDLTDIAAPTADFSMASHKVTNVTDPTSAQDAATKAYVDATTSGTSIDTLRKRPLLYSDFLANGISSMDPFVGVAIASGTLNTAGINPTGNHPGIVRIRSSTTTNSGASIGSGSAMLLLAGGELFEGVFYLDTLASSTFRLGFHDATTSVDAVDGAYLEIDSSGVATGKTASNSTRSTTASTTTLTAATWYRARITVNSNATLVTFAIYSDAGTLVWSDTLATNIPTTAGRSTGVGLIATNVGTTAVDLVEVDYMMFTYTSDRTR